MLSRHLARAGTQSGTAPPIPRPPGRLGYLPVLLPVYPGGGAPPPPTAGAQVPGKSVEEVTKDLLRAIDQYLEEE